MSLDYPPGIQDTTHVQFKFANYELRTPDKRTIDSDLSSSTSSITKTSIDTIVNLYVPGGAGTSISSKWDMSGVPVLNNYSDPAELSDKIKMGLKDAAQIVTSSGGVIPKLIDNQTGGMASSVLETMKTGLSANTGITILPNESAVFKGADPEKVDFNFVFAPRNPEESQTTLDIINAFKKASSGKTTETWASSDESGSTGNFSGFTGSYRIAESPPIFGITILTGGSTDSVNNSSTSTDGFYKYPDMVLNSFKVSFSDGETFLQTFTDGKPVTANLSVSFQSVYSSQQQAGNYRTFN